MSIVLRRAHRIGLEFLMRFVSGYDYVRPYLKTIVT